MKELPTRTRPTRPIDELVAATVVDQLACPACAMRRFVVTSTYWIREGGKRVKRRLRKCAACGHARTETVKSPEIGGETTVTENT